MHTDPWTPRESVPCRFLQGRSVSKESNELGCHLILSATYRSFACPQRGWCDYALHHFVSDRLNSYIFVRTRWSTLLGCKAS